MKKLFLLLSSFFVFAFIYGQATNNWTILFNNKVIFKGTDDQSNLSVVLRKKTFKKADLLTIQYKATDDGKGWERTFYINDSAEQNIKTLHLDEQKTSVSVSASVLNRMIMSKSPVFIYTISLPKDHSLAASVRVRRILLCKIEWN